MHVLFNGHLPNSNFSKWSRSEDLPSSFTEYRKFLKLLLQLCVFQPLPEDGEDQTWMKKHLNHSPPCGAIKCGPAGEISDCEQGPPGDFFFFSTIHNLNWSHGRGPDEPTL